MRTFIILALLLVLCGLAGCGQPDTAGAGTSTNDTARTQQPAGASAAPVKTPMVEGNGISEYVIPSSLKERIAISDAIVIGQVTGLGKVINGARQTNDPTKPSTSLFDVAQVYHFQVQRYLKGSGPSILNVAQSEGAVYAAPETVTEDDIARARAARGQIPLSKGTTYLLFLQRLDGYGFDQDYYVGGREPWRYTLSAGGGATPEALDEALQAIPSHFLPDNNAPLLPQVERLIQAERAAAPAP